MPRRLWQTADVISDSIPGGFSTEASAQETQQVVEPLRKCFPAAELWTFWGKKPWDTKTRDLCAHEKGHPHLLQVVPIHLWTDPPVQQDPEPWASFPAWEQAGAPSPPHTSPGGSWSLARGCRAQGAENKHNILSLGPRDILHQPKCLVRPQGPVSPWRWERSPWKLEDCTHQQILTRWQFGKWLFRHVN